MQGVQDRQYDVASQEPGKRAASGVRSGRPSYDRETGISDDAIDIVAVVVAIVLMTLIALAC